MADSWDSDVRGHLAIVNPQEDLVRRRLHAVSDKAFEQLIHTGGGDIDAAEKVNRIVRAKVGTGTLRVVVPDYAKSAGTLGEFPRAIALATNRSTLRGVLAEPVIAPGNLDVQGSEAATLGCLRLAWTRISFESAFAVSRSSSRSR